MMQQEIVAVPVGDCLRDRCLEESRLSMERSLPISTNR